MKVVRKFKNNEPIPNGAKYLCSKWIITGYEYDDTPMGGGAAVKEEFHYYEIQLPDDTTI